MDFALLQRKNPEIAWSKIVSYSKNVRKSQVFKNPTRLLKPKMDPSDTLNWRWGRKISEIIWITLCLFGLVQGYFFLTLSPYWTVSDVQLYGNDTLSTERLNRLIGPLQGENIFNLNLSLLAQKLDQHPWVHEVWVERKLPNTLHVHIKERVPMARIQLEKIYILDNFGVLLEEDSQEFLSLPLIRGIKDMNKKPGDWIVHESLAPSLKMMHYLNQLNFFQNDPVHEVNIRSLNRAVFTTKSNHTEIRMNLDNPKKTFEKLKTVLGLDSFDLTIYEYIDLSFQNQVVVKTIRSGDKAFHRS